MSDIDDPTNDEVLIGLAEQPELDAILRVMCAAFRMEYSAAQPIYFNDPHLNANDKMVVRCAQKIASCVTLVAGHTSVDQATLTICGLAGVATAPAYQRRGFATLLIESAISEAAKRGAHLALLTATQPEYYERRGWAVVGRNYLLQIDRNTIPKFNSRLKVRRARLDDADRINTLFDGYAGYSLKCSRSVLQWQGLLARLRQSVVVTDASGEILAYMLLQTRLGRVNIGRPASPPVVHVLEALATTVCAKQALLGWLAGREGPDRIDFELPMPMLRDLGLLDIDEINLRVTGGCMGYITNFPAAIAALSQNWGQPCSNTVTFRCRYSGGAESVVSVRSDRGKVLIIPQAAIPDHQPVVDGAARIWAQLITGYISAPDAVALGELTVNDNKTEDELIAIFPSRSPMLAPPDLF